MAIDRPGLFLQLLLSYNYRVAEGTLSNRKKSIGYRTFKKHFRAKKYILLKYALLSSFTKRYFFRFDELCSIFCDCICPCK